MAKTIAVTVPTVERKTTAAGYGALIGVLVVGAVDKYVLKTNALDGVTVPAVSAAAVTGIAFVTSFLAKHTSRPELKTAEALAQDVLDNPEASKYVFDALNAGVSKVAALES